MDFNKLIDLDAFQELVFAYQNPRHHPEGNAYTHCIRAYNYMCTFTEDPVLKFSALFHDIGKVYAHGKKLNRNDTYYEHDKIGGYLVRSYGESWGLTDEVIKRSSNLIENHMLPLRLSRASDRGVRRHYRDLKEKQVNLKELKLVCFCDVLASDWDFTDYYTMFKRMETLCSI